MEVKKIRRVKKLTIHGYNTIITEVSQDGIQWKPYGEVLRERHIALTIRRPERAQAAPAYG